MTGNAIEIAEFAIGYAHVGGVHVTVYDPGHLAIVPLGLPELVGNKHQVGERGMFKQELTFSCRKELGLQCFV
jgi:hypothetical protein